MKIACLSDLHFRLPKIPPVDLVLIAGDLSNAMYKNIWQEKNWLYGPFNEWLLNSPHTIIVGGNHDFYIQKNISGLRLSLPCEILENSQTTFNGVKIFGTPYTIEYCDWAYQATEPEHPVQHESLVNLEDVFTQEDCVGADIIISHGPPFECGDRTDGSRRCGSRSLRRCIEKNQPKLVLCGHIHEGYGSYKIGDTVVINCAYLDGVRRPRNEVVVVDYQNGVQDIQLFKEYL